MTVPVFLANSLQRVEARIQRSFFGDMVPVAVGDQIYNLPSHLVHQGADFDRSIDEVIVVANSYGQSTAPSEEAQESLKLRLSDQLADYPERDAILDTLGQMAKHIAELVRAKRDSIHGFLLKNHYRPAMLQKSFDYIVGNPPWLTINDIASPSYKRTVVELAAEARIAPRAAGEQGHTELATIFLATAATKFLRDLQSDHARLAFVMTRSVFVASQHRLLREGAYRARIDIAKVWDLEGVAPLFNMPACVLFVSTRPPRREAKPGAEWNGRLPAKDIPWALATKYLTRTDRVYELTFLGRRSAWRVQRESKPGSLQSSKRRMYYTRLFRQGAILYPQTLLTVLSSESLRRRSGVAHVRTDPRAAKKAWQLKDVKVNHVVDAKNLYLTAAAEHILPFALSPNLWTVILPTTTDPGQAGFAPVGPDELRRRGRNHTADWLEWAERRWARVRKVGDKTSLERRLDHLGHLTSQASMKRYLVLYRSHGSRPVAAVLDRQTTVLPFVVRDRTYWMSTSNKREAHYLAAFLNSKYAAEAILDWMTRGLFGPRDIHKRVLDVPWPRFDQKDPDHLQLACG